jgi:hypothetical protein
MTLRQSWEKVRAVLSEGEDALDVDTLETLRSVFIGGACAYRDASEACQCIAQWDALDAELDALVGEVGR